MARSYENYLKTSSTYDDNRIPVGLRLIRRALEEARPASGSPRLLDAGCGTGAYLAAVRDYGGSLVGLELNSGMLSHASSKLDASRDVVLAQGSVLSMPFADRSFDLVMFNQVLHHLDGEDGASRGWPMLRETLGESRRVLREGGLLLINTCTQQQLRDGFWYAALIPQAIERIGLRYVPVEVLTQMLRELGFGPLAEEIPIDEVFYGERALDPAGPFDPAWRNGDSVWALTTDTELQAALERLQRMRDAGEDAAFVAEREQARRRVGQCIFIRAQRG